MEWISVKDELPENGKYVLCWCSLDGYVIDCFDCMVGDEAWFYGTRDEYRSSVTHWMPLPKEPKA